MTIPKFLAALLALVLSCSIAQADPLLDANAIVPPPQSATVGGSVPSLSEMAERTTKGVIYAVGLFLLLISLYKRFGVKQLTGTQNSINILSQRPIGPKSYLLVVEVENQRLLLASTQDDVKLIAKLSELPIGRTSHAETPDVVALPARIGERQ